MNMAKCVSLFLLLSIGCKSFAPQPEPIMTDINLCSTAEMHLNELGCPEGKPLKDGTSFTKFCTDTQYAGIYLNPKCLSKITACDQVDYCTNSK